MVKELVYQSIDVDRQADRQKGFSDNILTAQIRRQGTGIHKACCTHA